MYLHSCLNLCLKAPGWAGESLSVCRWCLLELFAKEEWPRFTMILCSQRGVEVVRWTMRHAHYCYLSQTCSGSSILVSVSEYCCFDLHALLDIQGILIYSWLKVEYHSSAVQVSKLICSTLTFDNFSGSSTVYQPQPPSLGQLICHLCLLCILVLFNVSACFTSHVPYCHCWHHTHGPFRVNEK